MKYSLLLFLLLLLLLFSVATKSSEIVPFSKFVSDESLNDANLLVKQQISEKYTFRSDPNSDSDKNKSSKILVSKEYFNHKGFLIRFESINDYGDVSFSSEYQYNNEGLLSEIVESDNNKVLIQKNIFTYDAYSRLKNVLNYSSTNLLVQTNSFEYLEGKSIVIETIKDSTKTILSYLVHLYDKPFNRIIKTTTYDNQNAINGTFVVHYTDNGINSREVYSKDIDQPFVIKYQNYFNDRKLLSEIRNLTYPNNIIVSVLNNYYDNNLIKSTKMIDKSGSLITTISFEYKTK